MTADPDRDELLRQVEQLQAELDRERAVSAQWRTIAEERRVAAERLRQHPAVRALVAGAAVVRPPAAKLRRPIRQAKWTLRHLVASLVGLRSRLTSGRRERTLLAAVRALPPAPQVAARVSVVVLTHNGRARLERLLPLVAGTSGVDDCEVLVVDNGSDDDTAAWLRDQPGITVVRNEDNLSYSEANTIGARAASGDLVCFLNDDVEPLSAGWLARMCTALQPPFEAIGAQLVYPRRALLGGRLPDLKVQHLGIRFALDDGVPRPDVGTGGQPDVRVHVQEVAGATAACLLLRRERFLALGGFDEGYHYGSEDVDLCWRLRQDGGSVGVAYDAVLYHHEGATRHGQDDPEARAAQHRRNWQRFLSLHGAGVVGEVQLDRIEVAGVLAAAPMHAGITVTRDREEAGYGDWHTAHELGEALVSHGWKVSYLESYRDAWYRPRPDLGLVVVLHDTMDVRRIARPGLTTIAWVRNWADRWMDAPWVAEFDAILAGSERIATKLAAAGIRDLRLAPLATNPERFPAGAQDVRSLVAFTGNYWGKEPRVAELVTAVPDLAIYGKGWEDLPETAGQARGWVPYDQLPGIYRQAAVVVDHSVPATRDDGCLTARVFDAISSGALPVTNDTLGAEKVFDGVLPTYGTPEELAEVVARARQDPEWRTRTVEALRVIAHGAHTYRHRAEQVVDVMRARTLRPSVCLMTSAPDQRVAPTWGDWHLAEALARALRRRGHPVTVVNKDGWDGPLPPVADVAIHLRGRDIAPRAAGNLHVVWVISNPTEVTPEECDAADLVLVASHRFAEELQRQTSTPVQVLLQATDERRFRPRAPDARFRHDVAFVGNSRFVRRPIVDWALEAGLEPAIIGGNWERFVDTSAVVARFVPNEDLPVVYSSVKVLLNDHWDDMRAHGFVSNRIFDALACGAVVVSDDLPDLGALFGEAVTTCRSSAELAAAVRALLDDDTRRRELGHLGVELVRAGHTFSHRAEELATALAPLLAARGLET